MEAAKERQATASAKGNSQLEALRTIFARYVPLVEAARQRLTPQHERDELGTLAVFYKTAAELYMLAQDYAGGEDLCNEALRCFHQIRDFDCSSLIEGCDMLLSIAQSNKAKQTPNATAAGASNSAAGPSSPS